MDLGLTDKVAVITGASVGIGLAVAKGSPRRARTSSWRRARQDRLKKEARASRRSTA